VEGWVLTLVGTPATICEEAESWETVGGAGGGEAGCSEVDVPAASLDASIEAFAGGVQFADAVRVGPKSGHVSGNPPVRKLLAPVDKEGEDVVSPGE
jgi:hypothetical protein